MTGKRIDTWTSEANGTARAIGTVGAIAILAALGCANSQPFQQTEIGAILADSERGGSPTVASPLAPASPLTQATPLSQATQVSHSVPSDLGNSGDPIAQGQPIAAAPQLSTLEDVSQPLHLGQLARLDPFSVRDASSPNWTPPQRWGLTIDETIQIALANSTVLRDLGARVIQTPGLTPTIYGPAIQTTDPTSGIEAALSAYDAQVTSDLFFENNDRVLNNEFVGGGVNFFEQEIARFQSSLTKQAATGTLFTVRHNFEGDLNNSTRNLINGRAWTWNLEGEVRQPLMQGRGTLFNRIAGPDATPGIYNGVLIARLNADISITQLEVALRDYLSDVENAYWDLAFAYKDLGVKTMARDRSLGTYQLLKARSDEGLLGAERDKLAQAKEQYFRFEEDVQNALAGRLVVGTRAFNGSGGGTFQGSGGVYANERRLRLIMGLPINDGRLIQTASSPTDAPVTYDWNDVVANALSRRTELRRQQLKVERRQLELTASRNFTLPRLDALSTYRYRALGDRIYDPHVSVNSNTVGTGTHEWWLGLSLSYPVGYRQAHAGVRNAQLRLARERELLREVERQVVYGISNAIAENDRAYQVLRVAKNRVAAAKEQYEILFPEAQAPVRQFDFNALLDSERRFADAETNANRAAVQYALATKNLNFEMGTLLEYFNIHLAEGNWPRRKRAVSRRTRHVLDHVVESSPIPTETIDSQALAPQTIDTQPIPIDGNALPLGGIVIAEEPTLAAPEPAINSAERVIDPAQPVISPAQPKISPAQPVIDPAQRETRSAEPVMRPPGEAVRSGAPSITGPSITGQVPEVLGAPEQPSRTVEPKETPKLDTDEYVGPLPEQWETVEPPTPERSTPESPRLESPLLESPVPGRSEAASSTSGLIQVAPPIQPR